MHFDPIPKQLATSVLAIFIALLGVSACAYGNTGPVQGPLAQVKVLIGQEKLNVELANTDLSRQIGLMNRKTLADNSGMLFVFKRPETQCMWMKNTLIDLEVAFADEQGKILNVEQMKAGTTDIHCSKGRAKLALEMNQGWFSKRDIGAGQVMRVPESALVSP
jgi:uncharacterized membrane protein (UPF0127 family)